MRLFFGLFFLVCVSGCFSSYPKQGDKVLPVKKDSILCLSLKGPIMGDTAQDFMKQIRHYADNEKIKGVLVRVDSPGGSVGASQEIYATIKNIRTFYKKPVVVSAGDRMASGGVLSVMSADQIFVNPGTLFGSIGVVLKFINLEELARFAKVDPYHVKAGEFKDIGSSYRKMTLRERELLEGMMDTIHRQFKQVVIEGRGLKPAFVEQFSDGRIFTGAEAVEMGLADKVGSYNEAVRAIGKLSGLGSKPPLFTPEDQSIFGSFRRYLSFSNLKGEGGFSLFSYLVRMLSRKEAFSGVPLFILPSYL